jgi:ABC transporter substrate binding protein
MLRRVLVASFIVGVIVWPFACYAQQSNPAPPKRMGLLAISECPPSERWWLGRLEALGWIKGTVVIDCVSTVGRLDQLPALARELVSRRPDVLAAAMTTFVLALKQETTTIPIVMLATWEPEANGLVTSLARPEGNVTGVAWYDLGHKQVEILKDALPNLKRVASIAQTVGYPAEVLKFVSNSWRSNDKSRPARLELHGRCLDLPSRVITTKSLAKSPRNTSMLCISGRMGLLPKMESASLSSRCAIGSQRLAHQRCSQRPVFSSVTAKISSGA